MWREQTSPHQGWLRALFLSEATQTTCCLGIQCFLCDNKDLSGRSLGDAGEPIQPTHLLSTVEDSNSVGKVPPKPLLPAERCSGITELAKWCFEVEKEKHVQLSPRGRSPSSVGKVPTKPRLEPMRAVTMAQTVSRKPFI